MEILTDNSVIPHPDEGVPLSDPRLPAVGTPLLCLLCAYEKPWGVFDPATGASVCADCRDAARSVIASLALADVIAERPRQDTKWGGPAHDDRHRPIDWLNFITKQVQRAKSFDEGLYRVRHTYRQRLVKIGALAVAALESFDRNARLEEGLRITRLGAEKLEPSHHD